MLGEITDKSNQGKAFAFFAVSIESIIPLASKGSHHYTTRSLTELVRSLASRSADYSRIPNVSCPSSIRGSGANTPMLFHACSLAHALSLQLFGAVTR